jgi:hypothetical protein
MSNYTEFYLNSDSNIVQLETIELSHSDFTQTYRVVRNATNGITATTETGASVAFTYYPLAIDAAETRDNLDQSFKITLGDLGEILPTELDAVATADGFGEKPVLIYRTYRSDVLTAPLFVVTLEVESFTFNEQGSVFQAKAPSLNINKTGELYTFARFPMLRGFL